MEQLRQHQHVFILIGTIFLGLGMVFLFQLNSNKSMLQEFSKSSAFSSQQEGSIVLQTAVPNLKAPSDRTGMQTNRISLPNVDFKSLIKQKGNTVTPAKAPQKVIGASNASNNNEPLQKTESKTAPLLTPPIKLYFTRTEMLSEAEKESATKVYTVTQQELLLLQKIVMAEAEGEPYEGKVAVANVVLNRLRSANYPDTIHDVIYQKHQFSPVANGRLARVKPSEETIRAVNDALKGKKEVSNDTYYFLSLKLATDLTVHRHQTKTRTIGNHTFYK